MFAYPQASTGLHGPLTNHSQKKVHKKTTLKYYNFYIGLFHFNLLLSYMLHATATILLPKLPNTNMHIKTSILPQIYINIRNSPGFPIFLKLHIFVPLLWVQLLVLPFFCILSNYTLLYYIFYKEIASLKKKTIHILTLFNL